MDRQNPPADKALGAATPQTRTVHNKTALDWRVGFTQHPGEHLSASAHVVKPGGTHDIEYPAVRSFDHGWLTVQRDIPGQGSATESYRVFGAKLDDTSSQQFAQPNVPRDGDLTIRD